MNLSDKYIIRKILNNNVVISEDKDGKEIIITGQGVGFNKKIRSVIDSEKIYKIYDLRNNGFKHRFEVLLNEIPFDCLRLSEQIIDFSEEKLHKKLNQNLIIALADHINFAVTQNRNGRNSAINMNDEIKRLYKEEYQVSKEIVEMINDYYHITLSKNEIASIAFHLINAELNTNPNETTMIINATNEILHIIEQTLDIKLAEESLSYSRLVIHLKYFILRAFSEEKESDSFDGIWFNEENEEYQRISVCLENIQDYLNQTFHINLEASERMYLMIHIMRVLQTL